MSRHSETFIVATSYENAQMLCERATVVFKTAGEWQPAGGGLKKVVKQGWGLFTNPATIELEVSPVDGGCRVSVQALSIGFGPVQDSNVRNTVAEIRAAIERGLSASAPAPPPSEPPRRAEAQAQGRDVAHRSSSRTGAKTVPTSPGESVTPWSGSSAQRRSSGTWTRSRSAWIFASTSARRSSDVTCCSP